MKIKILGGGCKKCEILAAETKKAAEELGLKFELEKVSNFTEIVQYGVMTTPALVVDEELKFQGQVKKASEIASYLR